MKQRRDLQNNMNRAPVKCKTVFQLPNMHILESYRGQKSEEDLENNAQNFLNLMKTIDL